MAFSDCVEVLYSTETPMPLGSVAIVSVSVLVFASVNAP